MSFIETAIEKQKEARNANHAKWNFGFSCERCCLMGLHMKCEGCSIKQAHKEALERFGLKYIEEED